MIIYTWLNYYYGQSGVTNMSLIFDPRIDLRVIKNNVLQNASLERFTSGCFFKNNF